MTDTPTVELTLDQAMERALALQRDGQIDAADEFYAQINQHLPEYPDAWHFRGLIALQRGNREEAAALIRRAIEVAPEYADAHNNLGNVLYLDKRYDEAAVAYRRALALRPDMAEAHFNLGRSCQAAEQVQEALAAFRQGLALQPKQYESYRHMGMLLYVSGKIGEAALVYQEWLAQDPTDEYARHMLASCTEHDVPARASDACVQSQFDGFADTFDEKLEKLQYRAPALVLEATRRVVGEPAARLDVLDAGCGTGLCGPGLKPYARALAGVDLSPEMVKRAVPRAVYDELVVKELTAFLRERPGAWDLVVSADTLCYFGDLGPLMSAVAAALRPGGHLVFTVERATDADAPAGHRLNPHGRYSHTEAYARAALTAAGLTPVLIAEGFLRMEAKKPVPGLVVAAQR